ncbi:MAG: shikimate kinase [Planctomycetota bacterium]|nr:shikimate kinase [Planctomycetota bacterium]
MADLLANIYLIGYRGSGKTSIAPFLASALGYDWIDTDQSIEAILGEPIASFFIRVGEKDFRHIESHTICTVAKTPRQVVSLGGGAVLDPANQAILRSTGKIVWLDCPVDVLAMRLSADQTQGSGRPSLTGLGVVEEIESVLRVREPIYRNLADLIVPTGSSSPEALASKIATWWLDADALPSAPKTSAHKSLPE